MFLLLFPSLLEAQTAWERSVLLSASVQKSPPSIQIEWPVDPSANSYEVYRKSLEATSWGEQLDLLPGDATSFVDTTVSIGQIYEYAFFKKNFDLVKDTFCIESGAEIEFIVKDMYGIGLCCNFGFGYYSVEACGEIKSFGDNFGFADTSYFSICDNGNVCEEVIVTLNPDMFPNSTSWVLKNRADDLVLASSGQVGSFISERPKYGFISTGIEVAPADARGTLLLLVEKEINDSLDLEILQLELDLIKDHWKVIRQAVDRNLAVTEVKAMIQNVYQQTSDLSALYLLGHIPVPYSGDIYPDTHSENHQGAWSADPYYAELNGNWTDTLANISTAFFPRNHNIPGDGKFDQDSIPSKVELQMGRVDLSNLPAFAASEIELTRRYLQKAHAYKTGQLKANRRALIDDNFGQAFAGPAASGWRNFAPMFGADAIDELDYFGTLSQDSYWWSYGCGGGSHVSAGGIGNTTDFAQDSLSSIFTMLFGSQFGDWDNENNFLRAPLASGNTLTNCWAGSPPWSFHQMAMGYPIGYSALRSMNSIDGVYLNGPQLVHMALLGDPSLRMFMVEPLLENSLVLDAQASGVLLNWDASLESDIAGYYIYRASDIRSDFQRITPSLILDTFYLDPQPIDGQNVYQVKVVKLEESASGTYFNQSLGVLDSVIFTPVVTSDVMPMTNAFRISPNPSSGTVLLSFSKSTSKDQQIQLIDGLGRMQKEWFCKSGQADQLLSLEGLVPGVYFIKVGAQVKRLVLN